MPTLIEDEPVDKLSLVMESYASKTKPCFVRIGLSKIPDAGFGAFTEIDLPRGLMFGPYSVNQIFSV